MTDIAAKMRAAAYSATVGSGLNFIRHRLLRHDGDLRSSASLPARVRRSIVNHYANAERAEIALSVAGQYPGGDYFEFGSEGFHSFRNFLTAFHLNGLDNHFDTKFFAFDIFGKNRTARTLSDDDARYFAQYRSLGEDPINALRQRYTTTACSATAAC